MSYIIKLLKSVNSSISTYCIVFLIVFMANSANSQIFNDFNGNLQLNHQTFNEDPSIGAEERAPYSNGYINLLWQNNQFTFGQRLEFYKNPIPGFEEYKGQGISNRFLQFRNNNFDIIIGNYYEEFGSGLIFKTYFDPGLGIDNSIDGLKIKYITNNNIYLTGLIGKQKSFWGNQNDGMIRALNADVNVNNLILKKWYTNINIGVSFVTKQEVDNNPLYRLPENIGAWNGRINMSGQKISLNIDYAYKINDPSTDNGYIYKNGNALIIESNYSTKGLGLVMGIKRIDNMSFRSERNAILQDLNINYITPFTKQQSYSLATIYPYISQPNGEMGTQFEVYYKIPKKSKIGGKYGMNININFSNMFTIEKSSPTAGSEIGESGTIGYTSNFLSLGNDKLFQEWNIEMSKKFNKKTKVIGTYINVQNNDLILKSQPILSNQDHEYIKANIFILEILYKIKPKHATKIELQHLSTQQHFGNWTMGLIEYKLSPHWFWSIQDLYNYGNPEQATHYYSISTGYNKKSNRLTLSYGKQRAGLFCVGGVCREVPASNGLSISLTSSF
jgi:hypothetical protein